MMERRELLVLGHRSHPSRKVVNLNLEHHKDLCRHRSNDALRGLLCQWPDLCYLARIPRVKPGNQSAPRNPRDPYAVDLRWLSQPRRIASWRVNDVLIDCGPATCLDELLRSLDGWEPKALLLTHIHFDHAGAAGDLLRRWPKLRIFVHRRGARHLAEPQRLEASARRVFGAAFDARYGALTPVPERNLQPLDGGESVEGFRVLYTPGHAVHHVAFLDGTSGRAFVGDLAGVRLYPSDPVLPPTPPPDIDVTAWLASIALLAEHSPDWLGLTHFGEVTEPARHLAAVGDALRRHTRAVATMNEGEYAAWVRGHELKGVDPERARRDETVVPVDQNYIGLDRWVRNAPSAALQTVLSGVSR
jgi:glyoxylase-like metal-dependent hydrolase (beta-lactamase superfamily II)